MLEYLGRGGGGLIMMANILFNAILTGIAMYAMLYGFAVILSLMVGP
jgi:hypothetical protein